MDESLSVKQELPITGKSPSAEDIVSLLGEDEDLETKETKEPKEPKEEKEVKEPREDEEIELVEGEEEPEKLELTDDNIAVPPRKKEILKKYPELFKDFPFMEKIMYRDKQYTELFGSFDDAKEIAEKAEVFNDFEKQLLSGNTADILRNVKETDSKAFDKVVDSYLETLHSVDEKAYFEVIDKVNKTLIMEMVKEAKDSGNEDLQNAAVLVNQFLYGSSKFTPAKNRVDEKETKDDTAEKERLDFLRERFETSRDDLQGQVDNTLRATINEYIDPKGNMSSYVKKNAVTDTLSMVHELVANDPSVRNTLNKLWRAATDAKFSKDSLGKIKSFYLGKSKGVLGSAIKKARAEALKDLSPKREKEEVEEREPVRRSIPTGRPASQKEVRGGMKKGESVADYFARE